MAATSAPVTTCQALRTAFPAPGDVTVTSVAATVRLTEDVFATVGRGDAEDVTLWDERGSEFADILASARASVPGDGVSVSRQERIVAVLRAARALLDAVAGFDARAGAPDMRGVEDMEPYDPAADALLHTLRACRDVNTDRVLHITTYGTRLVCETPAGVQAVYDAAVLRGERNKLTQHLRGTDPRLQQTVRAIPEFAAFVRALVQDVEARGWTHVAVTCRGGHHRSVTVAEWLVHLYKNATVSHLTIDA